MQAKGYMMERHYDEESQVKHCYMIFMSEGSKHQVNLASLVWLGGDDLKSDSMGHDK